MFVHSRKYGLDIVDFLESHWGEAGLVSILSLLNFGGAHFDKERMFKLGRGGGGGKAEEMEK